MVLINDLVELQETVRLQTLTNQLTNAQQPLPPAMNINLQQHHFTQHRISSPMPAFGSLDRRKRPDGVDRAPVNGTARPQRLSTFRPNFGHSDLVRDCPDDAHHRYGGGPVYETIDRQSLSHLTGYSTDYGTASASSNGSSSNGHRSSTIEPMIGPSAGDRYADRCYAIGRHTIGHNRPLEYGPVGQRPVRQTEPIYESTARKFLDDEDEFSFWDALFAIISMIVFIVEASCHCALAYHWFMDKKTFGRFLVTAVFTVVPIVVVNILSLKWFISDDRNKSGPNMFRSQHFYLGWIVKIIGHLTMLGLVIRYLNLIRFGLKSRSARRRHLEQQQKSWQQQKQQQLSGLEPSLVATLQRSQQMQSSAVPTNQSPKSSESPTEHVNYHLMMVHEDRDTALLALLRGFMESAPQSMIQLYLLTKKNSDKVIDDKANGNIAINSHITTIQIVAVTMSIFSLGWSLANYHRSMRRSVVDKRRMSPSGFFLQLAWRCFAITSRVISVALFTAEFGLWTVPLATGHWGVTSVWIMHQGTRICDSADGKPRPCREYFVDMLLGAVYLVCFLNVKDEPTRYKHLAYYLWSLVENSAMIGLWFMRSDPALWYHLPALVAVFGSFSAGMFFMVVYYWGCHPNGRPLLVNRAAGCC